MKKNVFDNGVVYNGDCVIGMSELQSESADLIIADPPYNIQVGACQKSQKRKKAEWDTIPDYMEWSRQWMREAVRVLKPGGQLLLYGSPEKLWIARLKLMAVDEFGLDFMQHVSWIFSQGGDARLVGMIKYAVRMEHLEWFVKPGAQHVFNALEGAEMYTEEEKKVALAKGVGRVTLESLDKGRPPKNWLDIPRENSRSKERQYGAHPSMKPVKLCEKLVKVHSNVGAQVLIPFGGSGSEIVVAATLDRRVVGWEKDEDYFQIIQRRLEGWKISYVES